MKKVCSLALDGTDITVTLTAGDWAKEHYMLRVSLFCSDDGSSSSYGGVDNYEDEVSPGQTVTAKLRAGADFALGKITRQEAAVMLESCAKLLGVEAGGGRTFADQADVASWAAGAVGFVSGLSGDGRAVMGDTGAGAFTREQAMVAALHGTEATD